MFRDPPWAADYATKKNFFIIILKFSFVLQVRLRPMHAQWRYRLDVFADNRRIYFDKPALRVQYFPGNLYYKKKLIQYYKYVEYERNVNIPSL